ncbi:hypothetical protein MTO96_046978 [Rhipicephalus appendiculatus]
MYHSNVDWIFSVKEHADVLDKLKNDSCQVITVSETNISAPFDGYRSCHERKNFGDAHVLLSKDVPHEGSYPKHTRLYYTINDMPGNYCGMSHGNVVEAAMQAYKTLNNSLVHRCNNDGVAHSALLEKRVDVILGEGYVNCPDHCFVYRYAMHPPMYHYFLVRRSTLQPPSFAEYLAVVFLHLIPVIGTVHDSVHSRIASSTPVSVPKTRFVSRLPLFSSLALSWGAVLRQGSSLVRCHLGSFWPLGWRACFFSVASFKLASLLLEAFPVTLPKSRACLSSSQSSTTAQYRPA